MIKVGDYVRNKYGIAKVIDIEKNNDIDILVFDKPICFLVNKDTGEILKDKFTNRLPLIKEIDINRIKYGKPINLIEVGDYVNGSKVISINDTFSYASVETETSGEPTGHIITKDYIKSIVTKEQFESMEYKID